MVDFKKFFIEKDSSIIFNGVYAEVYIPKFYFEKNIATMYGNKVKTLGVFNFQIFSSIDNENKEKPNYSTCNIPTDIFMQPNKIEQETIKKQIVHEDEEALERVYILKFYKGDIFVENLIVEQSLTSVETMFKLLNNGKLPESIHYEDALKVILNNFSTNGFNGNVPSSHIEIIISEMYRDAKDISKSIRFKAASTESLKPSDYKMINLRKLSNANSTFTAVTGEDIYQALISSINKANDPNSTENISPIEKTIKY